MAIPPINPYSTTIFTPKYYMSTAYTQALPRPDFFMEANNTNPDQSATLGAFRSKSILFVV